VFSLHLKKQAKGTLDGVKEHQVHLAGDQRTHDVEHAHEKSSPLDLKKH